MKLKLLVFLVIFVSVGMASDRYELPCRKDLFNKSLTILKQQVGIYETGQNRGAVEKYYEPFGKGFIGQPYCAIGQYYCFWYASNLLALPINSIPIPKTALAYNVYLYGKKNGIRTQFKAHIGDLIDWKTEGSINGHIERIIEVGANGNVITVGFNTTSTKSDAQKERNGGGVYDRKRNIYSPIGRMSIKGLIGFKVYE